MECCCKVNNKVLQTNDHRDIYIFSKDMHIHSIIQTLVNTHSEAMNELNDTNWTFYY